MMKFLFDVRSDFCNQNISDSPHDDYDYDNDHYDDYDHQDEMFRAVQEVHNLGEGVHKQTRGKFFSHSHCSY